MGGLHRGRVSAEGNLLIVGWCGQPAQAGNTAGWKGVAGLS